MIRYDLIYADDSNFVELTNDKFLNIVENSLSALVLNGLFLVVESFVPNKLSPIDFISLIQSKVISDQNGTQYGFDLVFAKPDVNFLKFECLKLK